MWACHLRRRKERLSATLKHRPSELDGVSRLACRSVYQFVRSAECSLPLVQSHRSDECWHVRECKTVRNWKASEYYSKCKHSLALAGNPVYLSEPLCSCQILHFKSPCVCVYVCVRVRVYQKTCIQTCFSDNIKIALVKCRCVHMSK